MTDWKEITDPEELFRLKREGWVVEYKNEDGPWWLWSAFYWDERRKFRARPPQPKMKKVKMLCYLDTTLAKLIWSYADFISSDWIRIPAEDKEIEVPDGN